MAKPIVIQHKTIPIGVPYEHLSGGFITLRWFYLLLLTTYD